MPRIFAPPQLPPLKPLERLLMGITLLLLATPPVVVGHFLIGGWGSSNLVAEVDTPLAAGDVVLAEHLSPSTAGRESEARTDR